MIKILKPIGMDLIHVLFVSFTTHKNGRSTMIHRSKEFKTKAKYKIEKWTMRTYPYISLK